MKVGMSSDASYGVHHALILGAILRLILLVWGTYQDANSAVKYTDIDYTVISAAARCVVLPTSPSCTTSDGPLHLAAVGDPYARDTYRYTPLLALMVTPNIVVHASFGKVLFALADLVVGGLLYRLLLSRGSTRRSATIITSAVWILNPIIANISTRGSAESILGVMVVSTLALAEAGRWDAAAIVFGLAVHFKIYPVIYGSSLFVKLGNGRGITRDHWRFGMIALATFASLNAVMYAVWGHPFLEHTFIYHISRLDHRHNFSPYFYPIYLSLTSASSILRHPLASFAPQLGLSVGLGFVFGDDLGMAWFVQTFAFVTFNKVCTSQYFLWYLWLLPPLLPRLSLSTTRGLALIGVWVGAQALWLSQAYRLEMLGQASYLPVWIAGMGFLAANSWVLCQVIGAYTGKDVEKKVE